MEPGDRNFDLRPVAGAALRCAFCHASAPARELTLCPECGSRSHEACRAHATGCATIGCRSRRVIAGGPTLLSCPFCRAKTMLEDAACPGCERSLGDAARPEGAVGAAPLWSRVRAAVLRLFSRPYADRVWLDRSQILFEECLRGGRRHDDAELLTACGNAVLYASYAAVVWSQRGELSLSAGRTGDALVDFERALRMDPAQAVFWRNRGRARTLLGDATAGRDDLTRGLQLDPGDPLTWAERAQAHFAVGRLEEAERDASEAVRLAPQAADPLNVRTVLRGQAGDLDGALADARRAVELDPEHAVAQNDLGWVHVLRGEPEPALSALDRSITLDRDNWVAHDNRAAACSLARRPDDAERHNQRARELAPTEPRPWLTAGHLAIARRDLPAAEAALLGARRLAPAAASVRLGQAALHTLRGRYHLALQELDAARARLTAVERRSPAVDARRAFCLRRLRIDDEAQAAAEAARAAGDAPMAAFVRAQILDARGDLAAALAELADAPGIDEQDILLWRGRLHSEAGRHEQALADLDRGVALDMDFAGGRCLRAVASLRAGQPGRAVPDTDRALEVTPRDPWAMTVKARVEHALGRSDDAEARLAAATLVDPLSVQPWFYRAKIRADRGARTEAAADFEHVLGLVDPRDEWAEEALRWLTARAR